MTTGFPYILLADDDPDDRDLFCTATRKRYPHVGVYTFQDGDELLNYLNAFTWSVLPACIVVDYKMPRYSAPQVLRATGAGTQYARIPKVVWSASEREKEKNECLSLGAVLFVTKPESGAQLEDLINALQEWLFKPLNVNI